MAIPSNSDLFWYDVMGGLSRNTDRASKVSGTLSHIKSLNEKMSQGKAAPEDLHTAQCELVAACGQNFGMLIPYVFHRYPLDKPLDFMARPFMFAMTCMAPGSIVTLKAGRQVGKCVVGSTTVLTNLGSMTMEQVFAMGKACP